MLDLFKRVGAVQSTPTIAHRFEVDGDTVRSLAESSLERPILEANAELRNYPQRWRRGLNWVARIPELDYDRVKRKYRLETPEDLVKLQIDHPEYFVREKV